MRILVCGDRNWTDSAMLFDVLDRMHTLFNITCVIEGEARGADQMSAMWASLNRLQIDRYPADWTKHGKAAGPIRNAEMLLGGRPDLVVAFHMDIASSKGTKNMKEQAEKWGVPVWVFPGNGEVMLDALESGAFV